MPIKPVGGRLVDQDDAPVAGARVIGYYQNWLCSTAKTNEEGAFTLPKMPLSIDADQASYRVQLDVHETRNMRDGGVQIESGGPLTIRVRRRILRSRENRKPRSACVRINTWRLVIARSVMATMARPDRHGFSRFRDCYLQPCLYPSLQ